MLGDKHVDVEVFASFKMSIRKLDDFVKLLDVHTNPPPPPSIFSILIEVRNIRGISFRSTYQKCILHMTEPCHILWFR